MKNFMSGKIFQPDFKIFIFLNVEENVLLVKDT